MGKYFNQRGIAPVVIIIVVAILLSGGAAAYYFTQRPKTEPRASVAVSLNPILSLSTSSGPSATPFPTLKPTVKPTVKPTITPTPSTTSAPVQSGIHFEPNNITLTKKKSELGSNIAEVTLFFSGDHHLGLKLSDASIGIYGVFKDSGNIFYDGFHDQAKIQIGFVDAYGRGIKTGENKVTLQVVEADNMIDAANSSDIKTSLPITVTVTD